MTITNQQLQDEIHKFVSNNKDYLTFLYEDDNGEEEVEIFKTLTTEDWLEGTVDGTQRVGKSEYAEVADLRKRLKSFKQGRFGFDGFHFKDEVGYINEEYVRNNDIDYAQCWFRMFSEPEGDNLRIEIYTDPKDEVIIFYEIISD